MSELLEAVITKGRVGRREVARREGSQEGRRELATKFRRLTRLLRRYDRHCWKIGDLVADLILRHRLRLGDISRRVGYSKARLSEFHLTAREFPSHLRREGTFEDALIARRIVRTIPQLSMSVTAVREEVMKLRGKRPRQVKAHFIKMLLEWNREVAVVESDIIYNNDSLGLIDRPHHADWRDVIPRLGDGSVKVFICDPPFGGYSWRDEGGYASGRAATNGLRTACDNNTEEGALATTLPLFKECLPKLAPGGCLLLFQAGGKPDRPEILIEAAQQGWECLYGLTWQKGTFTPADCVLPYTTSSERILVFVRKGGQIEWHEPGLARSDVLSFQSIVIGATARMLQGKVPLGTYHMFQKPDDLCEFLVRKHTHPGHLVVEPFGCSGTFSQAAAKLGRQWVYIESNEENYRWGSQRLASFCQSSPEQPHAPATVSGETPQAF